MNQIFAVSRERLEGLTIFRVVLVTLFLLFALFFDVGSISTLTEGRSTAFLTLIVGTYLLSIVYSIVIRQMKDVTPLAMIQVIFDITITTFLVSITGGLSSLFIFLFHLNIVNATSITGRRFGMIIATITTVILSGFAVAELGWFDAFFPKNFQAEGADNVWVRMVIMSGAGYTLAFLSGYLSDRLGEMRTQLERQEKTALEQQALNEYILDGISSGVATIDEHGEVIFFNKAAVQITEMTKKFALGLSIEHAFPEIANILGEVKTLDWEKFASQRMEAEFHTKTGQVLFLGFSLSPLTIGDSARGLIIIFQNLTEIRQLESNLRRNQRLAAVGELAASIAHEIRNPLAAISGSVEMLEQESSVDSDSHMLHGIVLREVDRLNLLVTDFLNYSRPRPLEIQDFNLSALMKELIVLMKNKNKNIEIETQGFTSNIRIKADAEMLKQILWNLINNGYEAMGGRGKILIGTKIKKGRRVICVEDNGPGIPEELKTRIFEPFFTTKETGTGLGLATIFRLVDDHGGDIEISDAELLTGARFEFSMGKP